MSWRQLASLAKQMGEDISWKAFSRHFKKHFSREVQEMVKESEMREIVEKEQKEAIDILQEIKTNLTGLKALLAVLQANTKSFENPNVIRTTVEVYRELRQSLEVCERLSEKLSDKTTLTEIDLFRAIFKASEVLCDECFPKFELRLRELLREKGVE